MLIGERVHFASNASYGLDPYEIGRDQVFLVSKDEKFFAYVNACPHVDGAPLAWKKNEYLDRDRQNIVCSGHGALFDIETGVCTIGPCLGQALKKVELEMDDAERVFLKLGSLGSLGS